MPPRRHPTTPLYLPLTLPFLQKPLFLCVFYFFLCLSSQHLGGRRAGKGLITCPHRSPHGPRRFLLWGGRWYPFHLPLGLLQVLLPGWTRLSTTELPFAGEKRLKKRSPGPAAPQQSRSAPVHCSKIKKKLIHSFTHHLGQGTGHRPRVEAHLGRCHRMAWSTSGDFRGVCGAQHPLHVP